MQLGERGGYTKKEDIKLQTWKRTADNSREVINVKIYYSWYKTEMFYKFMDILRPCIYHVIFHKECE